MSINVNVHGNPIKIHRGKMVTADSDYTSQEFQKRRRMRLEQVRQQSKDIAEDVRNRVQKEKNKQLSNVEKQGVKELKKWQARKLLQLQQQYRECLKDIGLGHSQAVEQQESDYALETHKEAHDKISKERGVRAMEKLQRRNSKILYDKEAELDKKKYKKAIEDARARLVVDLNKNKKIKQSPFKKKKKRKVATDINISSRLSSSSSGDSQSESESEVPELLNLSSSSSSSSGIPRKRITKEHVTAMPRLEEPTETFLSDTSKHLSFKKHTQEKPFEDDLYNGPSCSYHFDTRISDRIKNRAMLNKHYPTCVKDCDRPSCPRVCDKKDTLESSHSLEKIETNDEEPLSNFQNNYIPKSLPDVNKEELPTKPPVTLRSLKQGSNVKSSSARSPVKSNRKPQSTSNVKPSAYLGSGESGVNKVQYYEHRNRYSKEYPEDKSKVQKISEGSIEVCPSDRSEAEFMEKVYKRDRDAEIRGQKAMEKVKVNHDYKEMMKQLEQLQKKERIASIPSLKLTKTSCHMSEGRLKDLEKKRQDRMENAYERLFPTARMITIPSKTDKKHSNLPHSDIILESTSIPSLNVGNWDHDFQVNTVSAARSINIQPDVLNGASDESGNMNAPELEKTDSARKRSLQRMLKRLKSHRDRLASELATLPESSTLHKLVGELGNIDEIIGLGGKISDSDLSCKGRKRCRDRKIKSQKGDEAKVSSSRGPSHASSLKKLPNDKERSDEREITFSRYHIRCTSGSSSSPSPPSNGFSTTTKRTTAKRKVSQPPRLVLQNTSTQTSPMAEKAKELTKAVEGKEQRQMPTESNKKSLTKLEIDELKKLKPCTCDVHDGETDLCEIVIKISEEKEPKICVSPSKRDDVIIRTEEIVMDISAEKEEHKEKPKVPVGTKMKPPTKPKAKPKITEKIGTSWREYFSNNSNTSTSYFSPPDFTSTHIQSPQTQHDASKGRQIGQLLNILREKPQQSNIPNDSSCTPSIIESNKIVEQQLLNYIKRLLAMSRKSVDDLATSTVSEISTPGSSIINVQTNIHLNHFEDLINHFNLNKNNIENILNYDASSSSIHYNTEASTPLSIMTGTISDTQQTSHDVRDTNLDEYAAEHYPDMLSAYNQLAENCAKKIENLTSLIEKVRLEKLDIIRKSPGSESDKENSTKYLDLPKFKDISKREQSEKVDKIDQADNKEQSLESLTDQDELDRQLLEVDYSLAEKLKLMTPEQIREQFPMSSSSISCSSLDENNIDQELLARFQNLKSNSPAITTTTTTTTAQSTCTVSTAAIQTNVDLPFVPLLNDIPRLPKLETPSITFNINKNSKPKPPPSKGLTAVKRFNIDVIPHELSTILESDSLMSSKFQKSKSAEKLLEDQDVAMITVPSVDSPKEPSSAIILTVPEELTENQESNVIIDLSDNTPTKQPSSSDSLPDLLTELIKNVQSKIPTSSGQKSSAPQKESEYAPSDSSASELENIETVLKSLGMDWAITTLRKTQEALALNSSSSSGSVNGVQQKLPRSNISISEHTLDIISPKPFLTKSNTEDSNTSSRFLRELQDASGSYDKSQEKTSRRTSTPIQSSKTDDKSKSYSPQHMEKMESDVSSVKTESDRAHDSGPFYSLNESSIRSKNNTSA